MKSSELLELTASEPLSYEEELDMQRTSASNRTAQWMGEMMADIAWHGQESGILMKIVRSKGHGHSNIVVKLTRPTGAVELTFILLERPSSLPPTAEQNQKVILPPSCLAQCRMVGDVNLFFPEGLEGDGECEIMIACMSFQAQKEKKKQLTRTCASVLSCTWIAKDDRRKRFAIEALSLLYVPDLRFFCLTC